MARSAPGRPVDVDELSSQGEARDVISVIIPAHDEASVIRCCLEAITEGAAEDEIEIIVVCNGCTDATAAVARAWGSPVRVIETSQASKIAALNLGDEAARGFPRFYVDADVVLPLSSIRRVADVLRGGEFLVAAPKLRVDLAGRNWWVRSYYEIWTRLPYIEAGLIGSGVYALAERGRARFERFPDIISDDGYTRLLFRPEERTSVSSAWFLITPPRSLRQLIHIKIRSQKGAFQLKRVFPELAANENRSYPSSIRRIFAVPRLWPAFLLYCYVMSVAKLNAYWKYYVGGIDEWERDDSSRTAPEDPRLGA